MKKASVFLVGLSIFTMLIFGCASEPKATGDIIDGAWAAWNGNYRSDLTINTEKGTISYTNNNGGIGLPGRYDGTNVIIDEINKKAGTVFFKIERDYEFVYEDPEDSSWEKQDIWVNDAKKDVQYTDPNDSSYTYRGYWCRYSTTAPRVGKWFAMSYKDLNAKTMNIRFPWKLEGKNCCDSLEEARKEFTIENGYFPSYGILGRN